MKKYIYIALMFAISLFASSASADITDLVNDTPTATTSAASAPEAAKPATSSLLKCAKNYGRAVVEKQASNPGINVVVMRVGVSSVLIAPLERHAAEQSGCFTFVEPGTPGVKYKVRIEMMQPTLASGYNAGVQVGLSRIPLFGHMIASQNAQRTAGKFHISEGSMALTVINVETGTPVISVLGSGKSSDVSLGAALLSANPPDILTGEQSQNISFQVIATEYADAFNKLVPYMDKLNTSDPAK